MRQKDKATLTIKPRTLAKRLRRTRNKPTLPEEGTELSNNQSQRYRLTEKQALFLKLLKENPLMTPVEAARQAGYSSPETLASILMKNPKIRRSLGAFREALTALARYTAKDIIEEIDNLAMSNISNVVDYDGNEMKVKPFSEIPERYIRTIKTIEQKETIDKAGNINRKVKVELHPKVPALDLAATIRNLKEDFEANKRRPDSIVLVLQDRETPLPKGPYAGETIDVEPLSPEGHHMPQLLEANETPQ